MARRVSFIVTARNQGFIAALDQSAKRMDKFARKMERTGRTMTRNFSLPIAAAGGAALKMASDFEASLSKVEGLVGVARSEVQAMRGDVLALAGQTARAPQELADALFFVTSAGLRGAEAIDVLEKSAKASAAGLGETKSIADLLTSAINAYGSENLSSAEATDVLTAAVREGKLEAESLAPVMGRLLPLANELGISFSEVSGFMAAMSRTGLDARQSSTALRGVMSKLIKPTEMAKKQLAEYGLSAQGLRGQLEEKGLLSVLRTLESTFGDNQEAMGKVFEDVEALTGVLNVLGQDADIVSGIMDGVSDSAGDMDVAFNVASDTMAFRMSRSLAELKTTAIEFGQTMLPVAKRVVDSVREIMQGFVGLEEESRKRVLVIAGLFAASGPILIAVGKFTRLLTSAFRLVFSKFGLIAAGVALVVVAGQNMVDNWEISAAEFKQLWLGIQRVALQGAEVVLSAMARAAPTQQARIQAAAYEEVIKNSLKGVNEEYENQGRLLGMMRKDFVTFGESAKNAADLAKSALQGLLTTMSGMVFETGGTGISESADEAGRAFERMDKKSLPLESLPDRIKRIGASFTVPIKKVKEMEEKGIQMGQALQSQVSASIVSFAETLGNAFTGDAGASGFFNNILLIVADFASALGKALVAAGIAAQAFQALISNPIGAIIAGGALIATAQVVRNLLVEGPTQKVNDALITSSGKVVEFHPDDNILAMKDFSGLGGGGGVIHNYLYLDGKEVFRNQKRIENDRLR